MAAAFALVGQILGCTKQEKEQQWTASSRTAISITGDIYLSSSRLRATGMDLKLRRLADNPRFEGHAGPISASLFALVQPSNPTLLNGNTFGCDKPVRWIATWRFNRDKELGMAVFDGSELPDSLGSPGFCSTYFYVRK